MTHLKLHADTSMLPGQPSNLHAACYSATVRPHTSPFEVRLLARSTFHNTA